MRFHAARPAATVLRRSPRGDRIMRGLILASGLSVLLMLAWVHLGLNTLLFAPAATPPQMVSADGPYVLTLHAESGQLVAGDANTVSLDLRDSAGHPVTKATVRVHADMTTMAMPVPDVTAVPRNDGQYRARLLFTMAGPWRLTVTIATPGRTVVRVAFDLGVRWR